MKETSTYYLLAWRPENDDQRNQKPGRVDVSVIGRPELVIRFRRRVGEFGSSESASRQSKPAQPNRKESSELLSDALRAKYPLSALPVSLTLNYVDVPQYGSSLTVSLKVVTDSLQYEGAADSRFANLDIAGAIFDIQGKPASTFSKRLTIRAAAGGVTTIVCQPDTNPAIDEPAVVDFVMRRARDTAIVHVYPMAFAFQAAGRGSEARSAAELPGLDARQGGGRLPDGVRGGQPRDDAGPGARAPPDTRLGEPEHRSSFHALFAAAFFNDYL